MDNSLNYSLNGFVVVLIHGMAGLLCRARSKWNDAVSLANLAGWRAKSILLSRRLELCFQECEPISCFQMAISNMMFR
jgi:hypothetical protein